MSHVHPTLGQLVTADEPRDCLHIAVAPVQAAVNLSPDSHVQITPDGRAATGPNPGYDRTIRVLHDKGYQRLDSFTRTAERGCILPESHWEIWAGPKGTLVLQVWTKGNGVHVLGTMGLGHTDDELKAAL